MGTVYGEKKEWKLRLEDVEYSITEQLWYFGWELIFITCAMKALSQRVPPSSNIL